MKLITKQQASPPDFRSSPTGSALSLFIARASGGTNLLHVTKDGVIVEKGGLQPCQQETSSTPDETTSTSTEPAEPNSPEQPVLVKSNPITDPPVFTSASNAVWSCKGKYIIAYQGSSFELYQAYEGDENADDDSLPLRKLTISWICPPSASIRSAYFSPNEGFLVICYLSAKSNPRSPYTIIVDLNVPDFFHICIPAPRGHTDKFLPVQFTSDDSVMLLALDSGVSVEFLSAPATPATTSTPDSVIQATSVLTTIDLWRDKDLNINYSQMGFGDEAGDFLRLCPSRMSSSSAIVAFFYSREEGNGEESAAGSSSAPKWKQGMFELLVFNGGGTKVQRLPLTDQALVNLMGPSDSASLRWSPSGQTLAVITDQILDDSGSSYLGKGDLMLVYPDLSVAAGYVLGSQLNDQTLKEAAWNPSKEIDEIAIIQGNQSLAEVAVTRKAAEGEKFLALRKLQRAYANCLLWHSTGQVLAVGGFGNLAGDITLWGRLSYDEDFRKVSNWRESCVVEWSFSPGDEEDGFLLTASTYPRMKVDNNIKIWAFDGRLKGTRSFHELYGASWKPRGTPTTSGSRLQITFIESPSNPIVSGGGGPLTPVDSSKLISQYLKNEISFEELPDSVRKRLTNRRRFPTSTGATSNGVGGANTTALLPSPGSGKCSRSTSLKVQLDSEDWRRGGGVSLSCASASKATTTCFGNRTSKPHTEETVVSSSSPKKSGGNGGTGISSGGSGGGAGGTNGTGTASTAGAVQPESPRGKKPASPARDEAVAKQSNVVEWYYLDVKGIVQGPFNSGQMRGWYNRRLLPASLPLRSSKDAGFVPLEKYFGAAQPFQNC